MPALADQKPEPIAATPRPAEPAVLSPGQRPTLLDRRSRTVLDEVVRSVPVRGTARDIRVRVATDRDSWEAALRLVSENYRAAGYEPPTSTGIRFTPHHALPDTRVFVAEGGGKVLATFTLVPDTYLLGLPMESIYPGEIAQLRQAGRRLAEVTSLAMGDLSLREFLPVFSAIIRLMKQYHICHDGDTWVITVNPRHRNYYTRVLGYVPLGPCKTYSAVQGHPAEAFYVDLALMKANAPRMHQEFFSEWLPREVLSAPPLPGPALRYLAAESSQTSEAAVDDLLGFVKRYGSPRRW